MDFLFQNITKANQGTSLFFYLFLVFFKYVYEFFACMYICA